MPNLHEVYLSNALESFANDYEVAQRDFDRAQRTLEEELALRLREERIERLNRDRRELQLREELRQRQERERQERYLMDVGDDDESLENFANDYEAYGLEPVYDDECDHGEDCCTDCCSGCSDCMPHRFPAPPLRTNDDTYVFDHSYKPPPVFYGEGPLHMGFELEVAVVGLDRTRSYLNAAAEVNSTLGEIGYLKQDSSISFGFEIVSHPMSYQWAMEHFPWGKMGMWGQYGIHPDHTTGLHVHVSRAAFSSSAHVYKWFKMMYRNKGRIANIARRNSSEWADWCPQSRREHIHVAKGKDCYVDQYGYTQYLNGKRYVAINTQNTDTFEVRIFNSTNRPQELQAALGLIDSSVRYAGELEASDILQNGGWTWGNYASWVKERDEYAPLQKEISKLCA